jgi:hypothetical protein
MSAEVRKAKSGILAYGSLIDDPGPELGPAIASTLENVETPFSVEYARSSQSRGGAPTLVPVSIGGAKVAAVIQLLNDNVSVEQASDWLWRREVRRYGSKDHYAPKPKPGRSTVVVEALLEFRKRPGRAVWTSWRTFYIPWLTLRIVPSSLEISATATPPTL